MPDLPFYSYALLAIFALTLGADAILERFRCTKQKREEPHADPSLLEYSGCRRDL